MDRIPVGKSQEEGHPRDKNQTGTKNPIDGFLLVIQVHEDDRHEGSLGAGDKQTDDRIPDVESVLSDIQPVKEFRRGRHDDGD